MKFYTHFLLLLTGWFLAANSFAHHPHDTITAVAVTPDYADYPVVLVGLDHYRLGSLVRSTNGGEIFSSSKQGLTGDSIRSIAVSPNFSADQTVFAISCKSGDSYFRLQPTQGAAAFKSQDGGITWEALSTGDADLARATAIVASPNYAEDATVFLAISGEGVLKSNDGGASWKRHNQGLLEDMAVSSIALSPNYSSDQTLFVGTMTGAVYRSDNGGQLWDMEGQPASGVAITTLEAVNSREGPTVFAGTLGEGVFIRRGGNPWRAVNEGLSDFRLVDLAASPAYVQDDTLFAATTTEGIFRSRDSGVSWEPLKNGLQGDYSQASTRFVSIAVSPNYANDHTLYLGTYLGLFKSTDGGDSWVEYQTISTRLAGAVKISPNYGSDNTVYASMYGRGVLRSSDRGATWSPLNKGLDSLSVWGIELPLNYQQSGDVFATTRCCLATSRDRGTEWNLFHFRWRTSAVAASPNYHKDKIVMVGDREYGIFKSSDGGESWKVVFHGEPEWSMRRIWGTSSVKVWDQGNWPKYDLFRYRLWREFKIAIKWAFVYGEPAMAWHRLKFLITEPVFVKSIAYSPNFSSDGIAFAGVVGGILKSSDSGDSWSVVAGSEERTANAVAVSPDFLRDRTVFAGTKHAGLLRSRDSGETWLPTNEGLLDRNITAVAVSPDFPVDRTLYAATNRAGIFKSSDGGDSWHGVNQGVPDKHVESLSISPAFAIDQTIFAGSYVGIIQSENGGDSWRVVDVGENKSVSHEVDRRGLNIR